LSQFLAVSDTSSFLELALLFDMLAYIAMLCGASCIMVWYTGMYCRAV